MFLLYISHGKGKMITLTEMSLGVTMPGIVRTVYICEHVTLK